MNEKFIVGTKFIHRKRILYFFTILLLSVSCTSVKKYNELESKNKELVDSIEEKNVQLDFLESKVFRSDIEINTLQLQISQLEQKISDLERPLQSSNSEYLNESSKFNYFYSLRATSEIFINDFFKKDSLLMKENNRLISSLNKMGFTRGKYKYFFAVNGYGVVTHPQRIDKNGIVIQNQQWSLTASNCSWFDIICSGKGYYRTYVFLIMKKQPAAYIKVDMEELMAEYNANDNLNYDWRSLPTIKKLLENDNNTANEYSLVVRVYEFSKEDLGDFTILASLTDSNLEQKLKENLN